MNSTNLGPKMYGSNAKLDVQNEPNHAHHGGKLTLGSKPDADDLKAANPA